MCGFVRSTPMPEVDGVLVRIPTGLRDLTGGQSTVEVAAGSVRSVVAQIDARHPGFADRVLDVSGVRRGLCVYLDGNNVRLVDGLDTPVERGSVLAILPAAGLGPTAPA